MEFANDQDACATLTTFCFKRLAILSLREIAVLLRNRANQIGIGGKRDEKTLYNIRYI